MSLNPEICIMYESGSNCKGDIVQALERNPDVTATPVHVNTFLAGEANLDDFQGLIFPGGFSYGDIIRAGALFAANIRSNPSLVDQLNRFVKARKPIGGNCNGFQVLAELGLLPDSHVLEPGEQQMTLAPNKNRKFECRWAKMVVEDSKCLFIPKELVGQVVEFPVAHAEGRLVARDPGLFVQLRQAGQVALSYCDAQGNPTEESPANPNGSPGGITGVCTETIFGMMPHDERFSRREHHPNWRRSETIFSEEFLTRITSGMVDYAKEI